MMKRLLALLLALVVSVSIPLTPAAMAAEAAPKAAVTGVEKNGNTLVVSWHGDGVQTVVTEVYTYTIKGEKADYKLLEQVRQAGDPTAQGDVDTSCAFGALPDPRNEGFLVKAWLEDQNKQRISDVFVDDTYTREIQEVLNHTAADYSGVTVDLTAKYGPNSFVALKDGVELIDVTAANLQRQTSGGKTTYAFTGVGEDLQNTLAALPGDTMVCVLYAGQDGLRNVLGVMASQLTISGGTMHITGDMLKLDQYAKASRFGTTKFEFHFKPNYDGPFYGIASNVTLTLTIGFAHKDTSVSFTLKEDFFADDTSLTIKTVTIGVTETLFSIPLGDVPYLGHVDFDYNLELYGTGMGSLVFDLTGALGFQVGASLQHGIQFNNLSKMPKFEYEGLNLDGEIFVGMGVGPSAAVAGDLLSFSLEMCAGMIIHGNLTSIEYKDNKKRWHACKPMECYRGDLKARVFFSGIINFLKYFSRSININIVETPEFATYYSSITFGDSSRKTDCPHYGYRLEVTVMDTEDNLVPNAVVSVEPMAEHYESKSWAKTNQNGVATLYLPEDRNTWLTLSADYTDDKGNKIHSQIPFMEYGYREGTTDLIDPSVTLIIDRREYKIHFADSRTSTGPIDNLPEPNPMVYYKGTGQPVSLPLTIPTKSGLEFIGWTDAGWGTTVKYLPGQEVDFDTEETMFALWKVAGSVYYILYDANRGTGAPHAEVHQKDDLVEIRLSSQVPERVGWKFMGWERRDDPSVLMQPGDLVYAADVPSDQRNTLELKARWELDTQGVYKVNYHLNGATGPQPDTQTVVNGEKVRITTNIPEWDDQHLFQGWAKDPKAIRPSCYPGMSYLFDGDTDLYALWGAEYRIIYGMDSIWMRDSGQKLRFIGNGNAMYFVDVEIDGAVLGANHFTKTSGSTVIDLHPDYLSKLPLGEHTIRMIYRDGKTQAVTFTIADPPPVTGDNSHPGIWCLTMIAALGCAVLLGKRKKA